MVIGRCFVECGKVLGNFRGVVKEAWAAERIGCAPERELGRLEDDYRVRMNRWVSTAEEVIREGWIPDRAQHIGSAPTLDAAEPDGPRTSATQLVKTPPPSLTPLSSPLAGPSAPTQRAKAAGFALTPLATP